MSKRAFLNCLLILLAIWLPNHAQGNLSVVFDLDGTYGNGPDTLWIEPSDTFSVDVWIVGDDSLFAFGITLGDTNNSLDWIEAGSDSVYSTDTSWTNTEVVEAGGMLLFQCTDFTLSSSILAPSLVASVKYHFYPGFTSAHIALDSPNSGWYNIALGDSAFYGFSGASIFVNGQLEGGGDGESPEGGDSEVNGSSEDVQSENLAYVRWPQFQMAQSTIETTSTIGLVADFSQQPIRTLLLSSSSGDRAVGVARFAEYSAAFQEFLKREDRLESLLDFYEALSLRDDTYDNPITETRIKPGTALMLEHILCYPPVFESAEHRELLRTIKVMLDKYDSRMEYRSATGKRVSVSPWESAAKVIAVCLDSLGDTSFQTWKNKSFHRRMLSGVLPQEDSLEIIQMGRSAVNQ